MITPITKRDPRKLYLERLVFMAALLIPAVFRGGFRPLTVCAVCVICCMFTDWVCCKLRRIKYDIKDPAVMFWGLWLRNAHACWYPACPCRTFRGYLHSSRETHFRRKREPRVLSSSDSRGVPDNLLPRRHAVLSEGRRNSPDVLGVRGTFTRSVEYHMNLGTTPTQSVMDILMGNVPALSAL